MIQNNVSLPVHLYGFVRTEFCNNLDRKARGVIPCVIFGLEAVPNRAPLFHVLREDGAIYSQLPIHALCHIPVAPGRPLQSLMKWDAFGWNLSVCRYEYLREMTFEVRHQDGKEEGMYLFTLDYFDNGYSEAPQQHKHFHFLALDDGNYGLHSNDFCRVRDGSFTQWGKQPPALQRNRLVWYAEE